jgi:hypothetical protein
VRLLQERAALYEPDIGIIGIIKGFDDFFGLFIVTLMSNKVMMALLLLGLCMGC